VKVSSFVGKVLRRLNRALGTERVRVYCLIAEDALPNLSCPPGLAVTRLLPAQMSTLREVFSSFAMSELEGAQRRQSQCYGAWLSGRLVHYAWVQASGSHAILEAGRHIDIKHGEFWIYDCRTNPSARGLGIYPYVLTFISNDHLRKGVGKGFVYTTEENVASQRGILKAGFQLKQTLRGLRIGGRYYPC
jgi:RimJ/RimL family protein N-acetyltransferase